MVIPDEKNQSSEKSEEEGCQFSTKREGFEVSHLFCSFWLEPRTGVFQCQNFRKRLKVFEIFFEFGFNTTHLLMLGVADRQV